MEKLRLGAAYHGNRFLKHVEYDMQQLVEKNMNLVVHMYTHNDMDRNPKNMKEIFDISKDKGLEVWVDNWGIGGPPGDKCHFLGYHPECRRIKSNGEISPVSVCFNHQAFVDFSKNWIDHVKEAGGDTLFLKKNTATICPKKLTMMFAICRPGAVATILPQLQNIRTIWV